MDDKRSLSSSEALGTLIKELEGLVKRYDTPLRFQDVLKAFILPRSLLIEFCVLTIGIAAILLASSSFSNAFVCGVLFLIIASVNVLLAVKEAKKRKLEVVSRLKWCIANLTDTLTASHLDDCLSLEKFEKLLQECDTAAMLTSPSHSISQVFKQEGLGEVIRPIPTTLLSYRDHILLRIGQSSPSKAECLEVENCTLARGDVFESTHLTNIREESRMTGYRFKVLQSPITEDIENYLSGASSRSPCISNQPTVFENQRKYLLDFFMKYVVTIVLILAVIFGAAKMILIPSAQTGSVDFNNFSISISNVTFPLHIPDRDDPSWFIYFMLTPALLCIPLYPIFLHSLFTILVAIGEAKTLALCRFKGNESAKYMNVPNTLTMSSQAIAVRNENIQGVKWWHIFWDLFHAKDGTLFHRNAGLFLPLGSLTVLCCVDKEGVLSWLNPITEKVFFFRQCTDAARQEGHNESLGFGMPPVVEEMEDQISEVESQNEDPSPIFDEQNLISETLSLSQDSKDPRCVRFDDVHWKNHLSSLKAIGLNVVLNLCSCNVPSDRRSVLLGGAKSIYPLEMDLLEKTQVINDVTPVFSFDNEQLLHSIAIEANCLPGGLRIARKGLCNLAEIIGISQTVKNAYVLQKSFTAYRKPVNQANLITSDLGHSPPIDCFATLSRRNKWKQYLPHFQGTVCEDLIGDRQILVLGTGDAVMEQCKDLWDGQDLRPITNENKRKALDFYQRSSVAGQCVAFGYSPMLIDDVISQESPGSSGQTLVTNLSNGADRKHLSEELGGDKVLNNMIFLGMTTLQHQAKFTVCHMVDALDRACIRFVHFSSDNEVRSRVFAEKMGLETGWNCHISLLSSPNESAAADIKPQFRSESYKSRTSSESKSKAATSDEGEVEECNNPLNVLPGRASSRTQSESSTTDSLFNVSNRAKLPRGIKNIVPHIENVDNVPLLVPLFTDSTPETAAEMIEIMKRYGEIVCCIGSADSIRNIIVFPKANVSIAIKPFLQPLPTSTSDAGSSMSSNSISCLLGGDREEDSCIALDIARKLNCFSCSVLLSGDNALPTIMNMITQARHFLFLIRIFLIFLGTCEVTLTVMQLFAHIILLPNPFTPVDVFWLAMVVFPCLSLSLFGSPPDPDLMTWANEKSPPEQNPVSRATMKDTFKRYAIKFIPSVMILMFCYFLALQSVCNQYKAFLESPGDCNHSCATGSNVVEVVCYPKYVIEMSPETNVSAIVPFWTANGYFKLKFRVIQLVISYFLVFYLCGISMGHVHRWKKTVKVLPFSNRFWLITGLVLISAQIIGSIIVVTYLTLTNEDKIEQHIEVEGIPFQKHVLHFGSYQVVIWSILSTWIIPCILINEFWKWKEIKMWNRWQKRARLDFGTKLGMNSPF